MYRPSSVCLSSSPRPNDTYSFVCYRRRPLSESRASLISTGWPSGGQGEISMFRPGCASGGQSFRVLDWRFVWFDHEKNVAGAWHVENVMLPVTRTKQGHRPTTASSTMYYEDEVSDGRPPYLLVYGSEEALSARLYKLESKDSQKEMGGEVMLTYRVQRFFRVMRGFHEVRRPPTTFIS